MRRLYLTVFLCFAGSSLLWCSAQEAPLPEVEDTKFSVDRGFYEEAFTVKVTTATPDAEIRYSLDGSPPDNLFTSQRYQPDQGILIETTTVLRVRATKLGHEPSNVDTQTYIFPEAVVEQPNDPVGFSSAWRGSDYGMDDDAAHLPLIAGDEGLSLEAAKQVIAEALRTLPTLSLVMKHGDLFGTRDGIYHRTEERGRDWERPVSVEWIDPDGGSGFQVDAGIRMQGFTSRDPSRNPKHSLRLVFRKEYGPGKLRFPIFGPEAAQAFDTLVLRSNSQDAWVYDAADNRVGQFVRDEWTRRVHLALGQPAPHGTWVHLYLNGLYWGVYNPTERPDASFMESYFGGEKEDYDVLKNHEEVIDGNGDSYAAALALIQNDPNRFSSGYRDLSSSASYAEARNMIHTASLIDYLIPNMYAAARDWPGNNYVGRSRNADSEGFYFFSWDNEHGMKSNVTTNRTLPHSRDEDSPTKFHHALKANEEYRVQFGDHLHRAFFNDGPLSVGTNINHPAELWMALTTEIQQALIAESARWGDYRRAVPYTVSKDFRELRERLLADWFPQRSEIVLDQFREEGLYPALHAPRLTPHGGNTDPDSTVQLRSRSVSPFVPQAKIYYTTDGSDPRLPGGSIHGQAQIYQSPISLANPFILKTRVKDGERWSALTEASFVAPTLEHYFGMGLPGSRDHLEIVSEGEGFQLSFTRRHLGHEDQTFRIEKSVDLIVWETLETPDITVTSLNADVDQVALSLNASRGSFVRLVVTRSLL